MYFTKASYSAKASLWLTHSLGPKQLGCPEGGSITCTARISVQHTKACTALNYCCNGIDHQKGAPGMPLDLF
jgi:hypothetical protein